MADIERVRASLTYKLQEAREDEHNEALTRDEQWESGNLAERIGEALIRLEKGSYGVCNSCRRKIEEEKLQIMDLATLCVSCARQHSNLDRRH